MTNNRGKTLKISSVGSVYKPRSNKPFRIDRRHAAGRTIAVETGHDANSNAPTRQYIYNSDVGNKEGTRGKTSVGTFVNRF